MKQSSDGIFGSFHNLQRLTNLSNCYVYVVQHERYVISSSTNWSIWVANNQCIYHTQRRLCLFSHKLFWKILFISLIWRVDTKQCLSVSCLCTEWWYWWTIVDHNILNRTELITYVTNIFDTRTLFLGSHTIMGQTKQRIFNFFIGLKTWYKIQGFI